MKRTESKPAVALLLVVALGIWGYNLRGILDGIDDPNFESPDPSHTGSGLNFHERTRILAEHRPPPLVEAQWEPFAAKALKKEEPAPEPQTQAPPPPPPPRPPAFDIQYLGVLEGRETQVVILRSGGDLYFSNLLDPIGQWTLSEITAESLAFTHQGGTVRKVLR